MSSSVRLTIACPNRRVDLAVPPETSVAELLTVVVTGLGREVADRGASEGGWVLQRAGSDPLHPAETLAAGGVVDGDVLHLRTRSTALPELVYDDIVDAVSDGIVQRTARWSPADTARWATIFAGAPLAVAAGTALLIGPAWVASSMTLGAGALLLTVVAIAVRRILHRRGAALTAAGLAIAYGAGCGATAVAGQRRIVDFGAPQLAVGAGGALVVAVALLVLLTDGQAAVTSVAVLASLCVVGAGGATAFDLRPGASAAVVAVVALACSPLLPGLALRLSRVPLPAIPLESADLLRDTGTVDARRVRARTVLGDQYLTGLVGGASLGIAGSAAVLTAHGLWEQVLAAVLGALCLLRARLFTGRGQRTVLLASGGVALVAELIAATTHVPGPIRLLACAVPAAVVGLLLLGMAAGLSVHRYAPPVSRAAELLESVLVVSVIPLAIGVVGMYGAVRQLGS